MGFGEAAADEEGLGVLGAFLQVLDGEVGDHVVAGALAVAFEDEELVGVGGALVVGGQDGEDAVGHGDLGVGDFEFAALLRGVKGFYVAVEVGPGFVVVEAGVEELAGAEGGVAALAKELGEGDPVGVEVADAGGVAEDLGGVGRVAGEERGARRIAEGELAVVAVEADALRCQLVDVGAAGVEAAGVAGELGAHVVGHEEEDVERLFARADGGSLCRGSSRDRGGEGGGCGGGEEAAAGGFFVAVHGCGSQCTPSMYLLVLFLAGRPLLRCCTLARNSELERVLYEGYARL